MLTCPATQSHSAKNRGNSKTSNKNLAHASNTDLQKTVGRNRLRRWWEFQTLYALIANTSSPISCANKHTNVATNMREAQGRKQVMEYAHPKSLQGQIKRQREWVYLSHYLAVQGLQPLHVISGEDDGREPDFTLIFYQQGLYYIGIELTTLPRLRDQMGEHGLIGKRWYWQGLQQIAQQQATDKATEEANNKTTNKTTHETNNGQNLASKNPKQTRFRTPLKTLYMPSDEFSQKKSRGNVAPITQADVAAVMEKKAHKVAAYHTRRPLDELWLLVHTDKYQPNGVLTESPQLLTHASDFDKVSITRYPSHKITHVERHPPSSELPK